MGGAGGVAPTLVPARGRPSSGTLAAGVEGTDLEVGDSEAAARPADQSGRRLPGERKSQRHR